MLQIFGASFVILHPGNDAFKAGKWKEAIEGYTKAIDIDPDNKVKSFLRGTRLAPSQSATWLNCHVVARSMKGLVTPRVKSGSVDPILWDKVETAV